MFTHSSQITAARLLPYQAANLLRNHGIDGVVVCEAGVWAVDRWVNRDGSEGCKPLLFTTAGDGLVSGREVMNWLGY